MDGWIEYPARGKDNDFKPDDEAIKTRHTHIHMGKPVKMGSLISFRRRRIWARARFKSDCQKVFFSPAEDLDNNYVTEKSGQRCGSLFSSDLNVSRSDKRTRKNLCSASKNGYITNS